MCCCKYTISAARKVYTIAREVHSDRDWLLLPRHNTIRFRVMFEKLHHSVNAIKHWLIMCQFVHCKGIRSYDVEC